MAVKIQWACTSFGVTMFDEDVIEGDQIVTELAHGILHEITLISGLNIPDLEIEE